MANKEANMEREKKQELYLYCKNREQRKNRYANKKRDKQKSERKALRSKRGW